MNQQLRSYASRCLVPLLLAALAALAGCAEQPKAIDQSWVLDKPGFTLNWQTTLLDVEKAGRPKAIYLIDDRLHIITDTNFAQVLAADSGGLQFFNYVADSGVILGKPLLTRNYLVYVTSYSLEIYNKGGRHIRSLPFDFNFTSGGLVRGDVIFVCEDNKGGRIAALDLNQHYNIIKWEKTEGVPGIMNGAPAYSDQSIFYTSTTGKVYSVDEDGHPDWTLNDEFCYQTGGPVVADMRADHFGVYVANTDGRLYVIDRVTGRLKWQYFANVPLKTAPQVTKDVVYQFVPEKGLVALEKSKTMTVPSGDPKMPQEYMVHYPRWTNADAVGFLAQDDKYVYAQSADGGVVAVDKQTGQTTFRTDTTGFIAFAVNEKGTVIYGVKPDGTVMSITPHPHPGATGHKI